MEKITNMRQSFADATEEVRTTLVHQFERLINKIVAQEYRKVDYPWDELRSMALEGFVNAMNDYDPARSKMTFAQYAGYAILNNIHNRMTEECRTVRFTSYAAEQARKNGTAQFTSVRIDTTISDDEVKPRETKLGMVEQEKFSNGDVYEYLYTRIDEKFNEIDRTCFYAYYGLKDMEEMQVGELAEYYKVTPGRISQRIHKVVRFIQKDSDLCEMLGSLVA